MKNVGIYCGHGRSADGTWDPGTVYENENEANLMLPITKAAVKYLRASQVKVDTDADSDNDINMLKQVERANAKKVDIFVSIHCDWYKSDTGTMPLYLSAKGKKLAEAINKVVMTDMQVPSRGATERTDLYELTDTRMPACIFETGSIKADLEILKKSDAYGKAIAKGICDYLGVKFKSTSQPTSAKKAYAGKFPTLPWHGIFRYFRVGDKGEQVKNLQRFLNWAIDTKLEVDGIYGPKTEVAVKSFQKKYSLVIDGEFGKKALAKAKRIRK